MLVKVAPESTRNGSDGLLLMSIDSEFSTRCGHQYTEHVLSLWLLWAPLVLRWGLHALSPRRGLRLLQAVLVLVVHSVVVHNWAVDYTVLGSHVSYVPHPPQFQHWY